MEKEFIPYDQALILKELGFDEPCFATYRANNELDYHTRSQMQNNIIPINSEYTEESKWISAPTFSQAFRWFREKYALYSHIGRCMGIVKESYFVEINTLQENLGIYDKDEEQIIFNSYEEAELECLKKLIEIAKEKLVVSK